MAFSESRHVLPYDAGELCQDRLLCSRLPSMHPLGENIEETFCVDHWILPGKPGNRSSSVEFRTPPDRLRTLCAANRHELVLDFTAVITQRIWLALWAF